MTMRRQTLTQALKQAIAESDLPVYRLAMLADVQRASIERFMQGRQSLRLDKADALARFFRIECRRTRRKAR